MVRMWTKPSYTILAKPKKLYKRDLTQNWYFIPTKENTNDCVSNGEEKMVECCLIGDAFPHAAIRSMSVELVDQWSAKLAPTGAMVMVGGLETNQKVVEVRKTSSSFL